MLEKRIVTWEKIRDKNGKALYILVKYSDGSTQRTLTLHTGNDIVSVLNKKEL